MLFENEMRIQWKRNSKEFFDLVNQDCFINIELKSYEATDKVVSLIEKYVAKKRKYDQF
jgi:glycerophosphoryl diester phosphodiesterase